MLSGCEKQIGCLIGNDLYDGHDHCLCSRYDTGFFSDFNGRNYTRSLPVLEIQLVETSDLPFMSDLFNLPDLVI